MIGNILVIVGDGYFFELFLKLLIKVVLEGGEGVVVDCLWRKKFGGGGGG